MIGSNCHYGHRNILNAYADVPVGTPIPGHVQHGWNYDLGTTTNGVLSSRPLPFFLWSSRNLRHCQNAGLRSNVEPLGAPFLYMPAAPEIAAEPKSLLVMPFHGWEKARVERDFQDYANAIRDIAKDFGKITVCLYWYDMQFPEYRLPFEELGADVVTVGHRDNNPRFLFDTRALMLRHEYVTANRVQTAGFYALALGRKFFLYGPPAGLDGSTDRSGELFHAWQKQEFPQLFWENFADQCHKTIGEDELGLEFRRDRESLRELFAWGIGQTAERNRRIATFRARVIRETRAAKIAQFKAQLLNIFPKNVQNFIKRSR